ncbi:MAG: VOC family protein [Anaerolineae bacterium]|nr:VOC family protein [Anaerolineae bacterium]
MLRGIDHIVILVDDLDQAIQSYTEAGFTVIPGGEHTGGATHNALVAFQDNSYLELIAFKRPDPGHRWLGKQPGIVDFALLPDAIADDLDAARLRGVDYQGPLPGGRLRPDGQQVAWQLGLPPAPGLPFLCADVTPRALRVPSAAAQAHANGALGIARVYVAVQDLVTSAAQYEALLGCQPETGLTDEARYALFPLGAAQIQLAEPLENPAGQAPSLNTILGTRGEGIYRIALHSSAGPGAPSLEALAATGAWLTWAAE